MQSMPATKKIQKPSGSRGKAVYSLTAADHEACRRSITIQDADARDLCRLIYHTSTNYAVTATVDPDEQK